MYYKLVFDQTGDIIPFVPINQEVLDFYIDHLDQKNLNGFYSLDKQLGPTIQSHIENFKLCIIEINKWLPNLTDFTFNVLDHEDYLDQTLLNDFHAKWVHSQHMLYDIQKKRKESNFSGIAEQIHELFPDDIQTPPFSDVISKLKLKNIYDSINTLYIHRLEAMFNNLRFTVSEDWTNVCQNYFPKSILTNNQSNISITFNNLGRTLYNKFKNFDMELTHDDENSFDELTGYVTVSLQPAQTLPMSKEFVEWCNLHNREPIGDRLNIGNIPNLYENLKKYRIIIFRNLLNNNKFSIHKH